MSTTADSARSETRDHAPSGKRFSIGGLIVSGLLFLSVLGNVVPMLQGTYPFTLLALIPLAPAVAVLLRSLRPPLGLGQGLATLAGGLCVAFVLRLADNIAFPGRYPAYGGTQLSVDLFFLIVGAILLWLGFRKPSTDEIG